MLCSAPALLRRDNLYKRLWYVYPTLGEAIFLHTALIERVPLLPIIIWDVFVLSRCRQKKLALCKWVHDYYARQPPKFTGDLIL